MRDTNIQQTHIHTYPKYDTHTYTGWSSPYPTSHPYLRSEIYLIPNLKSSIHPPLPIHLSLRHRQKLGSRICRLSRTIGHKRGKGGGGLLYLLPLHDMASPRHLVSFQHQPARPRPMVSADLRTEELIPPCHSMLPPSMLKVDLPSSP